MVDSAILSFIYLIAGALLLLLIVGIVLVVLMPGFDRWNKRYFSIFFSVLILSVICSLIDSTVAGNPEYRQLGTVIIFLEYLLPSALASLVTAYLLHFCGEDIRHSALIRTVVTLLCIQFSLLAVSQFTTCFYYITADNLYYRGPWHPALMAPLALITLVNLVALFNRRNELPKKQYRAFFISLFPITIAMIVHTLVYVIEFVYLTQMLCMLSMFALTLSVQLEQYTRQQNEIAHQRASIMVLQMRPHFIYNTMMTIYYLCEQDARKAQQVTLDFTSYLRKNFTAIASENVIPFSEELEHTRAYLSVEQAQFEDQLFVDYDTPHTRFNIPPLTLQPIVENAVKHGMDPDSEPLRISIKTRETKFGSEIIVEDNGPGYNPPDNSEPHIALANIRQRLEMMCHGEIEIYPREGGGTAVKVRIPCP